MEGVMRAVVVAAVAWLACPHPSTGSIFDTSSDLNNQAKDNWVSRLYQDKMEGYNRDRRPVMDHTHPTTLSLGVSLKNIHLDDELQEFSINAWTIMTWKDEFLEWNPDNYMNIERLHFDADDIWMPDITVYNSAEGSDVHPFGRIPVLVDNAGKVFWFPPTHLAVNCDLDLTSWPKDKHQCVVRIGSWAHHGEQIDIQIMQYNDSKGVMLDSYEVNNQWELLKVTATRNITNLEGHDPYVEVNFVFEVQRQARTYATYITQSTFAVVVVVLLTYLLPLERFFSRLVMHLFGLAVLITCYFSLFDILPANGGPLPLVVRYYAGTLILTSLSLLATVLLTARRSCCCCTISSSKSGLGKKLVGMVTFSSSPRNLGPQSTSSTHLYNHLENELVLDEEERPTQMQISQVEGGEMEGSEGEVDSVTGKQAKQVINCLLLVLFSIAYVVDYLVLRNVTL